MRLVSLVREIAEDGEESSGRSTSLWSAEWCIGTNIELAVYRALYAHSNARVQTDAIALASQANSDGQPGAGRLGQVR